MPNTLLKPEEVAKDILSNIKKISKKYYPSNEEKRKELECRLLDSFSRQIFYS